MSSSSILSKVASVARSRAATSATRIHGLSAHASAVHRTFVTSALTRSALPRRLYPCDMFLVRNASTAARAAFIPEPEYAEEVEAELVEEDQKDPATHFSTLADRVHPDTLKAITVHPFQHKYMSAVQARIFPLLPHVAEPHDAQTSESSPRDLLVKAKTGTGKTMGFLVPAIEARLKVLEAHVEQARINSGLENFSKADAMKTARNFAIENVGTLIISPTRELATQIAVEAQNLTTHHQGFGVQVLVGGENKRRQMQSWTGRKDIVVATPGRLMDLLDNEWNFAEVFKNTRVLVLDEADTLLEMGFREDIERISNFLPLAPIRQTFLFSATVSKAIQGVAQSLLHPRHTFINCVSDEDVATHTHIPQYTTTIKSGADAIPHVLKLIAHDQLLCKKEGRKSKIVLFTSTTKMTQLVADVLQEATRQKAVGVLPAPTNLYEMHSKRDMEQRIKTSKRFREDSVPSTGSVMVTSDVSARGVDYPGVTRVIQLGLPPSVEMYVHRVGRTGRGGDRGGQGRGDLVISEWEQPWLRELTRETGTTLKTSTSEDIDAEVKQLLDDAPSKRNVRQYVQANYDEITNTIRSITERMGHPSYDNNQYPGAVSSELISSTLASHAGFYAGRFKQLNNEAMLTGLQSYFQEMCAHSRPINLPRRIRDMMSGGGGASRDSGYKKRGSGFGYTDYGAGRRDRYSDYDAGSRRSGGGRGGEREMSGGWDAPASRNRAPFGGRDDFGGRPRRNSFFRDQEPADDGSRSFARRDGGGFGRRSDDGGRRSGGFKSW